MCDGEGSGNKSCLDTENRCACARARFLVLRLGFTYCVLAFGATLFDFNYGLYVDYIVCVYIVCTCIARLAAAEAPLESASGRSHAGTAGYR